MKGKDCRYCDYYSIIHASMQNPQDECYCTKHMIDFTQPPEPDEKRKMFCDDFILSDYGVAVLNKEREDKLKRVLNGI